MVIFQYSTNFVEGPATNNLRDKLPVNIRQSHMPSVEKISHAFVIQPQQMKDGRMQVVTGYDLFFGFVANLVGRADLLAAFDSGSGHKNSHSSGIVIASDAALGDRHAPEL
jgi:hypothetical protein